MAGQVYHKKRLRLHETMAESIVILHEARRFVAQRIIDTSPTSIQDLVKESLQQAGAISDDNSSIQSDGETEGSYGSSDCE